MSNVNAIRGHQITVQIGNGADPEVFTHTAQINTTRGVTLTATTESGELVDLADQSLPATTVAAVKATNIKVDGNGVLQSTDVKTYSDWLLSGEAKNVKVIAGNATFTGPFLLTQFQVSGERMSLVEAQITLEQADKITVTATV
ncbi:phage tail protein [Sphingobium sp. PNB]|uniref:phage tail tube protein n=1 Tax=Sphingobium sp. PNB TaxID=863934 RepID=UPI001CA40963|nr:phage tail tube protein [Sphingobium sp. PNB]MCB4861973.1 phage tail protein [Sphingobium sp. PNB]